MIETLERRSLLTAAFSLEGTTLRVTGTPGRDDIAFGISPDGVTIDINVSEDGGLARQEKFDVAGVRLIEADLGDGADLLIVGRLPIPVLARGGTGDDSLSGGQADDTLLGEGGADYVFGREGNDRLDGGQQGDILIGGLNDDWLVAGSSLFNDDTIAGGRGEDTVDYSAVIDQVFVHVGTDLPDPDEDDRIFGDVEILIGSPQDDTILNGTRRGMRIDGGAGNDSLTGGSGDDTLIGGAGTDLLRGVGGRDELVADDGEPDLLNAGGDTDFVLLDADLDAVANAEAIA